MIQNKFFKLYGNCIPVKGYTESIICDLERCQYLPITNRLIDVILFSEENGVSINDLKANYNNQNDQGIDALFNYIQKQGYGFYTNEPEIFPKISLEWDSPYILTNAVVEVSTNALSNSNQALYQLSELGIQAIEIRFYDIISFLEVSELLQIIDNSRIRSYFLFLKYSNEIKLDDIMRLYYKHNKIGYLVFHSAPINYTFNDQLPQHLKGRIIQIKKVVDKNTEDIVSMNSMVLNMPSFTESINFNLGLNRKVSIDINGNIKNYLSHKQIYGNIQTDRLKEIISKKEFQKIWKITKDQVEVCKDCQYRYMCVDNSELILHDDIYRRKTDCSFSPYNNTWVK